MEKILLFKKRNLGETIGTAFELMRVNFRLISVSFLIMVMPLLLLTIGLVSMGIVGLAKQKLTYIAGNSVPSSFNRIIASIGYFGYLFTLFVEAVVLHEAVIAYEHSHDPGNIKVSDVWALIKSDLGRIISSFLGLIPLALLMGISTYFIYTIGSSISSSATGLSILLIYLLYIYINTCMSNYLMLRLRSEYSVFTAVSKCISLTVGKGRWWRTLGVHFVTTLVAFSFYSVSLIPFGVILYVFFAHQASLIARDQALSYYYLIIGIGISYAGVIFAYCLNLVLLGSTANYYSLVEEKEHVGLQINIGNIGVNSELAKNQEGEY